MNLPPMEGLHNKEPEEVEMSMKEKKIMKQQEQNLDFKIMDFEKDLEAAKAREINDIEEEDAVYEKFEKKFLKKEKGVFEDDNKSLLGEFGLWDTDQERTHKGKKVFEEAQRLLSTGRLWLS